MKTPTNLDARLAADPGSDSHQPAELLERPELAKRHLFGLGMRALLAGGAALALQPALAATEGALPSPAPAGEDAERENLARVAFELERLHEMVVGAARTAPSGQRVAFRYEWLARDLDLVRRGVLEHLDAPRQPRPVAPLRGEYRQ